MINVLVIEPGFDTKHTVAFDVALRSRSQSDNVRLGRRSSAIGSKRPWKPRPSPFPGRFTSKSLLHWLGELGPAESRPRPEILICPANDPSDSDLSHPAVHVDFHARDVRRIWRSQKCDGRCHFLGLSKPLHRKLRNYFLREFIEGFLG